MATRDVLIHPYYAGHGYACMRVDLRGSGESDGVLEDEHAPQEQEGLLEVIAWIARRPWCSGGVGMTGISWGVRLEHNEAWVHTWLAHQRRDGYWKHGSVCEDYAAIEVPVYAIGATPDCADGYTNAVLRLREGLSGPHKGLIGPWGHGFPHNAAPGPAIGFLQKSLRWWDHWLGRRDTGVMDEPMLRVWMQESTAPSGQVGGGPGSRSYVRDPATTASRGRTGSWTAATSSCPTGGRARSGTP